MNGEERHRRRRDGRFTGFRVNVEQVPRLPVTPARWALTDSRNRSYRALWERERKRGSGLVYWVNLIPRKESRSVELRLQNGRTEVVQLLAYRTPKGAEAFLYLCPSCSRPTRYLYLHAVSQTGDGGGWLSFGFVACRVCAGLRWVSQGRYRSRLSRAVERSLGVRVPLPRRPWDPRAFSVRPPKGSYAPEEPSRSTE